MPLIKDLLAKPPALTTASKYTMLNGIAYLAVGLLLIVWPGATQTLFMDPAFVGHEQALMRVIGLTIVVIGWFYLFGGRSGARQIVAGFRHRPIGVRACGARATSDSRRLSSFVFYVRDFRRIARHWRLGSSSSRVKCMVAAT